MGRYNEDFRGAFRTGCLGWVCGPGGMKSICFFSYNYLFMYLFLWWGWFPLGEADPAIVYFPSSPVWSRKGPSRAPLASVNGALLFRMLSQRSLSPSSPPKKALLLTAPLTPFQPPRERSPCSLHSALPAGHSSRL